MWELYCQTGYEEQWAIAYFETKIEAEAAVEFLYAQDLQRYPKVDRKDYDFGYSIKEIRATKLVDFMVREAISTEEQILREQFHENPKD